MTISKASIPRWTRLASISSEFGVTLDALGGGTACWIVLHLILHIAIQLDTGPSDRIPAGTLVVAICLALFAAGIVASHSSNLDRHPSWARKSEIRIFVTGLLAILCEGLPALVVTFFAIQSVDRDEHVPASLAALWSYRAMSVFLGIGWGMMLIAPLSPAILLCQMVGNLQSRDRRMHPLLRHAHWMFLAPYILFYFVLLAVAPFMDRIRDPGFATPREALIDYLEGIPGDRYDLASIRIEEEGLVPSRFGGGEEYSFLVIFREDAITRFRFRKNDRGWMHAGSEGFYTRDNLPLPSEWMGGGGN